jgi:hypothetical protein
VILTDGESCGIKYHREIKRQWEEDPFLGTAGIGFGSFLRDRKTGKTYISGLVNGIKLLMCFFSILGTSLLI